MFKHPNFIVLIPVFCLNPMFNQKNFVKIESSCLKLKKIKEGKNQIQQQGEIPQDILKIHNNNNNDNNHKTAKQRLLDTLHL